MWQKTSRHMTPHGATWTNQFERGIQIICNSQIGKILLLATFENGCQERKNSKDWTGIQLPGIPTTKGY